MRQFQYLRRTIKRVPFAWIVSAGFGVTCCLSIPAAADPWQQITKLSAFDPDVGDNFGYATALSGSIALVGAYLDDEFGVDAGAAYLFRDQGNGNWSQIGKLNPNDIAPGDWFGYKVAIDGQLAVIGAISDDKNGTNAGAAYIFHDDGSGNWSQVAKLLPDDLGAGHIFGQSVAISGSTVLIGSSGDGNDGAAYIFKDVGGGNWQQVKRLIPSDEDINDRFGWSVALDGSTALVGAVGASFNTGKAYVFRDDGTGDWNEVDRLVPNYSEGPTGFAFSLALHGTTAVIGNISFLAIEPGNAHVYSEDGSGDWKLSAILSADDVSATDSFGAAVAIEGNRAVVGARYDGGVNVQSGSAYVFRRNSLGDWLQVAHVVGNDTLSGDHFGWGTNISGNRLLVAAPGDDNPGMDAGSVYIFNVPEPRTVTLTIVPVLSFYFARRRK